MKVDGWMWRLKLKVFRFWFCFHWIMFLISWELDFCFKISFIWFSFYQQLCLPFVWFWMITCDVSFLFFNRFYFCFGYKICINQVSFNWRTNFTYFFLQRRHISVIFKPKNQLGPEPESTSGCTGLLKIY